MAEHLRPGLATPFEHPSDRLVDLVFGIVCSCSTLAAVLWLVLSIQAHKQTLLQMLTARLSASE